MLSEKQREIDTVADTVRHVYGIGFPVGDMKDVVKRIGGEMASNDGLLDGRIAKYKEDSFAILVPHDKKGFNTSRIRFIVAHELGHLFLHMYFQRDREKWKQIKRGRSFDKSDKTDYARKQMEANEFAWAFLMPRDEFYRAIHRLAKAKNDELYVESSALAAYFNVSEVDVICRGKTLGIFE